MFHLWYKSAVMLDPDVLRQTATVHKHLAAEGALLRHPVVHALLVPAQVALRAEHLTAVLAEQFLRRLDRAVRVVDFAVLG